MERKSTVILVMILAVLAVGLLMYDPPSEPEEVPVDVPSNDPEDVPAEDGVTRLGDLVIPNDTGLFDVTMSVTETGTDYVFEMDPAVASAYTGFQWSLRDNDDIFSNSSTGIRTEPTVTWSTDGTEVGEYTLTVLCTGGSNQSSIPGFIVGDRYSVVVCIGTVEKVFNWTYEGRSYTIPLEYHYFDFMRYDGTNAASLYHRSAENDGNYDVVYDFMVVDGVLSNLEKGLRSGYMQNHPDGTRQGYAEFVLAFVQSCFGYVLDSKQYWQDEYFAFPMETIHHGAGDCEDTSILYAAIMDAAGYDAGVFLIPNHAVGAVALEGYVPEDISAAYVGEVGVFSMTSADGSVYYACETTLDGPYTGVGWIDTSYSVVDGKVYYNDEPTDPLHRFGLYPITHGGTVKE